LKWAKNAHSNWLITRLVMVTFGSRTKCYTNTTTTAAAVNVQRRHGYHHHMKARPRGSEAHMGK
jgi:hypothetical protein